jgi:hypothetical protein
MITFPTGTWLLYEGAGLKAGTITQPGQKPGERFRASLVLDGLTSEQVVTLCRALGLAPFPEWEVASPERTRSFFGLAEDHESPEPG